MTVGRRRLGATGLAALAITVLLTGCAPATLELSERPQRRGTASPTQAAATSPAASPTPEESPAEVPPEPAPTAGDEPTTEKAAPGKVTLRDRLLTADQVPTLTEGFSWSEAATRGKEGRKPFATCHKFAMTSIGASSVASRTFEPSDEGRTASTLVASFADEMTAKRAFEVLKSWRGQCDEELQRYDRRDVGPLEPVSGAKGAAGWYLLTYGPAAGSPDQSYYDAQGLVRVGSRIAVVQLRLADQGYDFDAGKEPMVEAVRSAAAKLG